MTSNTLITSLALTISLLTGCSPRPDGTSGASKRADGDDLRARLVGEWKGVEADGATVGVVFRDDSSTVMYEDDEVFDAKDAGGKLIWRAYGDGEPLNLDIVAVAADGSQKTIKLILRFLSDTKIEIRMTKDPDVRPTQFEDPAPEGQVVLTRQ